MNFFIFCLFTRKPLNFLFASKFGPFKLFLIPSPSSSSFYCPSSLPSVGLFFNNSGSYTKYILIPTKHYKALSESHSPIRNNNKIISELIKTKLLFSQVFRLSIFNKCYFYLYFFLLLLLQNMESSYKWGRVMNIPMLPLFRLCFSWKLLGVLGALMPLLACP